MGVEAAERAAYGLFAKFLGIGIGDILGVDKIEHFIDATHAWNGVGLLDTFAEEAFFEELGMGGCGHHKGDEDQKDKSFHERNAITAVERELLILK